MVIAEIVKHALFEPVGVGVSNPDKVGRDVGEICGLGESVRITATDDVDALIALAPGCLATGMRALNAVPAVNDLSPGWVTALDLPLIPGAGTIR